MTHWFDHSLVLASDYRVPEPALVWPLLQREETALGELGAHHVLVYTSTTEPQRMLVLMALHSREPVLDVLRSPVFLDWFDDFGVKDIPAVFAGELLERLDFETTEAPEAPQAVAAVVTAVDDVAALIGHVNGPDFLAAGIRKMLIFRAFDDPNEVMLLFGLQDEASAAHWLLRSEATSEWLRKTGIGAYPPLFVGRCRDMMRVDGPG